VARPSAANAVSVVPVEPFMRRPPSCSAFMAGRTPGFDGDATKRNRKTRAEVAVSRYNRRRRSPRTPMRIRRPSTLAAALLVAAAAHGQPADTFVPVTDAMLQNPDPADWLMWRRTLDSWGYSPLDEIDRSNVGSLRMVWTRALGPGIQEGTPLVYDGVMYFPNPSDLVQAFDAATGDLKWEYRRSLPSDLGEYFPVPSIN